jgi:hypothetical protein
MNTWARTVAWAGTLLLLAAGVPRPAGAHDFWARIGAPASSASPVLDGAISEPLWYEAYATSVFPANCTNAVQRIYTVRTPSGLYVAIDVPESATGHPLDTLLLFMDRNHNGTSQPDSSDRAVRLLGFPAGSNQNAAVAEIYSGSGFGWGAPAPFYTARSSRSGSGPDARLRVEVALPSTSVPAGFALVYLSGDAQDCDGDGQNDNLRWPPTLPDPSGVPGLADPRQWGDLVNADWPIECDARPQSMCAPPRCLWVPACCEGMCLETFQSCPAVCPPPSS